MSKVIIATSGAYSDYSVVAILEWLRSETPEQARDRWLEMHPKQREDYGFESYQFVAWLVAAGYARDVEAEELHLDSYSSVEKEWHREPFKRYV